MNKPRTDIIDITKIKRPILVWWETRRFFGIALDMEIVYPNSWREQYWETYNRWEKAKTTQEEFEFNLIAWQYI